MPRGIASLASTCRLVAARCQFVRVGSPFGARYTRLVRAIPVWCALYPFGARYTRLVRAIHQEGKNDCY